MSSDFSNSPTPSLRSTSLDLTQYNTDKIPNGYLSFYDPFFTPHATGQIAIMELGVLDGGALELWHDYFPHGQIIGIDRKLNVSFPNKPRIHLFEGDQGDPELLDHAAARVSEGLDYIIDDASHIAAPTSSAFWHLFTHHLKPGGWYFIEDWGTGYWENWPDGKKYQQGQNHMAGMVGFVKSLVDEIGAHDRSRDWYDKPWTEDSRFEEIRFVPSIVAIKKRSV